MTFPIEINGSVRNHTTLEDAIKHLNNALYYCDILYIIEPFNFDAIDYTTADTNEILAMFEDIETYELEGLKIAQTWD